MVNIPKYTMGEQFLDFSPVTNALAAYRNQANQDRAFQQGDKQFQATNALARAQLGIQQQSAARADQMFPFQLRQMEADIEAKRRQGFTESQLAPLRMRQMEAQTQLQERQLRQPISDGSKVMEVNGQLYRVPLQGDAQVIGGGSPQASRAAQAREIGLQPGSPEEQFFMANGKLPAAFFQTRDHERKKSESGVKIAEGLSNLAKLPGMYGESFESAVGPWQGSDPDSLVSAPFVNIARAMGEIGNRGKFKPTEIRANIKGNVEALAAAVKPLIRGPGEGVWTDADQARLVAVVGDLATASNAEEYYRRLNDVRDRIKANFGLDINFEATPKNQGRLTPGGQTGQAPPPASAAPSQVVRVQTVEEAMRLPPGTQFMTPDGRLKVR